MLSDDEIKLEGRSAFGIDPILDGNLMRFARAVERAAYERAAALVIELTEDSTTADAIRALGRQHD